MRELIMGLMGEYGNLAVFPPYFSGKSLSTDPHRR